MISTAGHGKGRPGSQENQGMLVDLPGGREESIPLMAREGLPSTIKTPLWIYNSNELAYDLLPAALGQLSKGENSYLRTEPELGTIIVLIFWKERRHHTTFHEKG